MQPAGRKKPIWYNSDDEEQDGAASMLALRTPPRTPSTTSGKAAAMAPPFVARPHDIISLLSASSPGSESSDAGSTATDKSSGPPPSTAATASMSSSSSGDVELPALQRMSSVSLTEAMDVTPEDGEVVEERPVYLPYPAADDSADDGYEPNDDEKGAAAQGMNYSSSAKDDLAIPLNCVTQDKVLHPRKRPAPSPASARGYPTGAEQYSWKRQHYQQPPSLSTTLEIKAEEPQAEPETPSSMSGEASPDGESMTSVKIDSKSSTLATLASNLLRQLEEEAVGTLVVCQPTCLDHHNDSHQESRQRLTVLGGPEGVLLKDRFRDLTWANLDQLRPARLNDLLRVHTFEYIQHLERACGKLPLKNEECLVGTLFDDAEKQLPYSEWLKTDKARACFDVEDPPSAGTLDLDSPISKNSYLAARMAAGAVCHAIDKVLTNQYRNAFVVVRPPGHHAGPNGCVEGEGFHLRPEMCTCGFCLLNNVCIGAAYAMANYSSPYYSPSPTHRGSKRLVSGHKPLPSIERIAIVDFDIHHGNGTEEIIRNLVPHSQNYPLPSSWAPVSFPSYKPWRDDKDADNVFFASIHLFDDDNFYPCSGAGPNGCSPELRDRENIINMPLDVLGPRFLDERQKLSSKAQKSLMERASKAFRKNVTERLLPALSAFQPDLIMLSAGFDGHADDFYYFLSEDDYGWVTEQIAAVAEDCCDGRIVSVLEGGYNVVPAKNQQRARSGGRKGAASTSNFHHAAKLHNREVDAEMTPYGSLARSCAAHVAALQRASRS